MNYTDSKQIILLNPEYTAELFSAWSKIEESAPLILKNSEFVLSGRQAEICLAVSWMNETTKHSVNFGFVAAATFAGCRLVEVTVSNYRSSIAPSLSSWFCSMKHSSKFRLPASN